MITEVIMKNKEGFDASLFHRGISTSVFDYLGAHRRNDKITFRVWAPHADQVYLVGDFNCWSESHSMTKISDRGIWECSVEFCLFKEKPLYKYKIINGQKTLYKSDPYGRHMQCPPDTATVWYNGDLPYDWSDAGWLNIRKAFSERAVSDKPLNIYEVHLGSFMRRWDGSYMSYRELAPILASYLKKMSYTHIELLPISEHSRECSFGNETCGFYSPTSRFGSPDDFKFFVNTLHNCGIGVILRINLTDFSLDEHGLSEFDGEALYEYSDVSSRLRVDNGTSLFDISKPEVQSFLISNACYYAREYHIDGLTVSEIAPMMYLDYKKSKGEWIPNRHGFEAVAFLKQLVRTVKKEYPDILMIADSGQTAKKIFDTENCGVGFDLQYNRNWTAYTLDLYSSNRSYKDKNTESFLDLLNAKEGILPISYDYLCEKNRALLDKMPYEYSVKFAAVRSLFTHMMTLPQKKLSFMSNEFGQFSEWNCQSSVEWFMLEYDTHRNLRDFIADLNAIYLDRSELWELDCSDEGFDICDSDLTNNVIAYKRTNKEGKGLTVIISRCPNAIKGKSICVADGQYRVLISSEDRKYGASKTYDRMLTATKNKLTIDLCAYESLILEKSDR